MSTGALSDQPTLGMAAAGDSITATGQERFGDYLLLCEVGRGGMGVVYKALDPGLGRNVAIKMVLSAAVSDPADLKRFQAEASAAARLQHPNIVSVHRVGCEAGRHFYAMDFIDGNSLAARLAAGPLPGKQAAAYVRDIARAIHHAHQQGILHRDIKPANVLIDADNHPHITDFGLAKHFSRDDGHTKTGAILGTPGYMAPEQANGSKSLTPATDVYGLGATLYECITARPPFRGESALDTLMMVTENDPAPPRLLNPRVDSDLETICLKCLARSPGDRYRNAAELADDLERYIQGESIRARSLSMFDYIGRSLGHSQYDVEFRQYGTMLLLFAAIVVFTQALAQWAIFRRESPMVVTMTHILKFLLIGVVLWRHRPHGLRPTSTAERQMWSIWLGYVIACSTAAPYMRIMFDEEALYQGKIYSVYCCLTGLSFFVLGSSYWGGCYALAGGFFALGYVLAYFPTWGALIFGVGWAVVLVLIAVRLRSLDAQPQTAGPPATSS
jgi:serine/threonine-protein kinase